MPCALVWPARSHQLAGGALLRAMVLVAAMGVGVASPRVSWALAADAQAKILMTALAYDRNLPTRAGSMVTLLVLSKGGAAASESCSLEMGKAFGAWKDKDVAGLKVSVQAHRFEDAGGLAQVVQQEKASALYVCPGLEGNIEAITGVSRKYGVLTFGVDTQAVRQGLSLAVVDVAGKPKIILRLASAKAEGANFSAALLRLAQVVD